MTQPEKFQDRQKLANLISQWNQDHYDLFELCAPNEALEFHGVVRFYFQDEDHNVVTKCIRVASSATTREVVDVLVEKFRPDMRMLGYNKYNLFEVHINGEERQLLEDERVLYAQLGWGKDVREGRFLLRREGASSTPADKDGSGFKRKLSKREKKVKKRQDKERKMNKENVDKNVGSGVAEQLYTDAPETSFTRSISNPEAVMKRRRQQKLEKKLQQFHGQQGQGGTLKIYGETLKPDVPYKTLLLSTADTVRHVIKEAMEKYGIDTDDTSQFVLVEVLVPPGEEYHGGTIGEERILDDDECPLSIAMQHPPSRGMLMFQLKRKNADQLRPKNKRQRAHSHEDLRNVKQGPPTTPDKLPFLLELNPDGTENMKGKVHRLRTDVTEVGSEPSMSPSGQNLQLSGPDVQPRHCVITHLKGIISVTPTSRDAETYVNNKLVYETTLLQHGATVEFGKNNAFRFFDPAWEEPPHPEAPVAGAGFQRQAAETNFDMSGRVETMTDGQRVPPPHPQRQESRQSSVQGSAIDDGSRGSPHDAGRLDVPKLEDALPAALEFRDERENDFLSAVILDVNASGAQFKLSPTYTLYLAVRYRLSAVYRPDLSPADRAHKLTNIIDKIGQMVPQAIQESRDNPATLAFWMANASEVLHFFKQDRDVHPFSQDSQEHLAEAVQMAFHHLVRCLQYDLQRTLPAFLDDSDSEHDEIDDRGRFNKNKPSMADILDTLSSAMNLLRRCRVNAALTIQLFSQLFHFVNMWVFNILVTEKRVQLCTRVWGMRLKRRLGRVEAWAEKQGLELAADCHLCRIIQAAHLLQAPKSNPDDIANISSTCFKLNSLQLRELLQRYIPEPAEPQIPQNLIERVVSVAENMADELIRSDGRSVQLEEDQDLQLPFLLPEDGYSCDTIKGVPSGMAEYIEPMTRASLCRMTLQQQSSGYWTVYMSDEEPSQIIEESIRERKNRTPEPSRPQPPLPKEPEIIRVSFNKVKGSMGLSIVAAKGDGQRERGIYIKSVVHEGAAAIDGRLQAGDQLLEVDGKSLVGLTQEKAAELMTRTGHTVTLNVAKQGAFYHGLATLLSQPSPVMPRASPQKAPTTPSKQRPGDEGPPPYNGVSDTDRGRPGLQKPESRTLPRDLRGQALRGADSRSSPALNMPGKVRRRNSHRSHYQRHSWHAGPVRGLIRESEIRDKRAWAEQTFPGARLGQRKDVSTSALSDISRLKDAMSLKQLHLFVKQAELRDYRVRAQVLTPKGEYFGMKNFDRCLSVASYFSRELKYPMKVKPASVQELVSQADDTTTDNVFLDTGLPNTRSPPDHNQSRPVYSDSTVNIRSPRQDRAVKSDSALHIDLPRKYNTLKSDSRLDKTPPRKFHTLKSDKAINNYLPRKYHTIKSDSALNMMHSPIKDRKYKSESDTILNISRESGMSAAERLRVPSANKLRKDQSNVTYRQPQQPPQPHGPLHKRENRELMDKSKSIPNLHMDNSFDGRPDNGMMRPAQSVNALQQQRIPNTGPDYYNQPHSLDESRTPDYENQPIDPRLRGYPNTSQPSPESQHPKPHMQQSQGTPTRSQPQSFERPHSQYFSQQERPDHGQSRPKSEEVTPERLRQWQEMERSQGPHDQSFDRAPNYSNIRPQPNYANQGEIKKIDIGSQQQQPNFYENTVPRQQDAPPPFQQLRRPPGEGEKALPGTAPKPPVGLKPNQPLIQPAEIPRSEVDNRQTQPHFYNVRSQDRPGKQNPSYNTNTSHNDYQNTNFHDGRITNDFRSKVSPGRETSKSREFPTPPHDIAPELPPPPTMDDVPDEDLPPLPPPPVTDYRLEQKIREEQNRLLQQQQQQLDPSYSNLPPSRAQLHTSSPLTNGQRSPQDRNSYTGNISIPPQPAGYQPQISSGYQPPHSTGHQPPNSAGFQPQQSHSLPAGYQPSHDYQNINYPNNPPAQQQQQQQQQQNLYETYDPRRQKQNARPAIHKGIKDQRDAIVSPWNREEREKQQMQQEEEANRQREAEISELDARSQRSAQEEERLRKLRLDQEFQRRLQEVADKDDEEDSDTDERPLSRMSVQTMQEDLVKSRMRMQELDQRRQYDEMDKERDRMESSGPTPVKVGLKGILKQPSEEAPMPDTGLVSLLKLGLERKLEVFERERGEQKKRLQRRSEKQQQEQEEYLRKQREARDKHKQDIEENIRIQKQEEEKLQQRKLEEERRRKEMEKQRLAEIQAQKEAEEAAAREQIRRQEDEYARQRLAEQERRRREEEREIRVAEERKRLELMANQQNQNQNQYYQQYANLPPQASPKLMMDPRYNNNVPPANTNIHYTPPPPERGSSYNIANSRAVNSRPDEQMDKYNGGYRVNNPTSFRSSQENIKKVSFNPQMPGQQGQMSNAGSGYNEPEQQSPPSSYQPFQRAYVTPEQNYSRTDNTSYSSPSVPVNSESTPNTNNTEVHYRTKETTPNVIGAQEIYRDPRSRIEAKIASKGKQNTDRLSFRDKMKFFATEAGENTPINKPKASTTQRRIESQLHNGQ